jgi:hypothetical protein
MQLSTRQSPPPFYVGFSRSFSFWLIFGCGIGLLAAIKPGQPWDGDAELYIANALNILRGTSYADTYYVLNSAEPHHPQSSAPGLPLMLLPILALFGVNYVAIKAALVCFFIGFLGVMSAIAAREQTRAQTAVLILALGLNPFIWMFKDVVYSEFPFMLVSFTALYAVQRLDDESRTLTRRALWTWALILALALVGTFAIRAAGIALFAAIAALCCFRNRYFTAAAIGAMIVALIAIKGLALLFPADIAVYTSFFDTLRKDGVVEFSKFLGSHLAAYIGAAFDLLLGDAEREGLPFALAILILGASILALGLRAWQRVSIFELYAAAGLAMLVLFPIAQEPARYALPLFPILILALTSHLRSWALGAAALALSIVYMAGFMAWPQDDGLSVDRPEAVELYAAIRTHVPQSDLIIASHPTVIGLYAERRATNPVTGMTAEAFWRFAQKTNARWLVKNEPPLIDPLRRIESVITRNMEPIFANRQFTLYRIAS